MTPYVVQPMASRDVPLPSDPLTRSQPRPNLNRAPTAALPRAVPVPAPATAARKAQLGAARFLFD